MSLYSVLGLLTAFLQTIFASTQLIISPNHDTNSTETDWSYDNSYDWGKLNPKYSLCQVGTTQSPIRLSQSPGLSQKYKPRFLNLYKNYISVPGYLYNVGYGIGFEISEHEVTKRPSLIYDNTMIYLSQWHIHAPAEHVLDDFRSRAELHLVYTFPDEKVAGVIGILINPGRSTSEFFSQFVSPGELPDFNSTDKRIPLRLNHAFAFEEVDNFREFWTYSGSLTTPPCEEGVRWWVARKILYVSTPQFQELLRVTTYSARILQSVWEHDVNG